MKNEGMVKGRKPQHIPAARGRPTGPADLDQNNCRIAVSAGTNLLSARHVLSVYSGKQTRHGRASSFSGFVTRILPSRRLERGHTLRVQHAAGDGVQNATDLVFGLYSTPGNHAIDSTGGTIRNACVVTGAATKISDLEIDRVSDHSSLLERKTLRSAIPVRVRSSNNPSEIPHVGSSGNRDKKGSLKRLFRLGSATNRVVAEDKQSQHAIQPHLGDERPLLRVTVNDDGEEG